MMEVIDAERCHAAALAVVMDEGSTFDRGKKIEEITGTVEFDFSDGSQFRLRLSNVPKEIRIQLALHGALQKISDSYAGCADEAGRLALARAVIERLYAGQWNAVRTPNDAVPRDVSVVDLAKDLGLFLGWPPQLVERVLVSLPEDELNALRPMTENVKAAFRQSQHQYQRGKNADLTTIARVVDEALSILH